MSERPQPAADRIVDYDSGFDYCAFWDNRDYELWLERRVLRRLLPRLGRSRWFADFGGGFGRNAVHYLRDADRALLIDYSVSNLTRAGQYLAPQLATGQVELIRADLGRLPLRDGAVETAMVVRVLHHLGDVEACLTEMARVVSRSWLVDVPIKHHVLGRIRAAAGGRYGEVVGPRPLRTGSTEYPFYTFQLAAVRRCLERSGFATQMVASVNNFRRWDQLLPGAAVSLLRPAVYPMELAAERLGRGWWGPSQFLLASRRRALAPIRPGIPDATPGQLAELARLLCCPACRGQLRWSAERAQCPECQLSFPRRGPFWDFTSAPAGAAAPTQT